MYLTYFDESGDIGIANSPTNWFVLNAVLVHESAWLSTNDALAAMKRTLQSKYGIAARAELKAVNFRNGKGAFRYLGLSMRRRMQVYREVLEWESRLSIRTFSVAVQKKQASNLGWDPRYAAWAFALHTLDRFCIERDEWATLFPDEGHGPFIRRCLRELRLQGSTSRRHSPGGVPMKIERILEDPNDRHSHDSYFIQIADLNAYAAHRHPRIAPGPKGTDNLWACLNGSIGDIRIKDVQLGLSRPAGILTFPK